MPTEYTYKDWLDAKAELQACKERYEEITEAIALELLDRGVKSELDSVDGIEYQFTVVQSETMKFDEDSLLQAMGKRAFARIANLKLDKKKLEAAINDGTVDAGLVARNTVISRNSPYIRATEYRGED